MAIGGKRYRFDADYREEAVLLDGTQVVLRLMRPEDKELLVEGLARLSLQTRYRRFLEPKLNLSPAELKYLTEIDGVDHFAIGAVLERPGQPETGLGIARFVRLPGEETVAEPAIVVVDEFQRRGLGGILLQRLVAAARERGIRAFRALVLAENAPIQALIRDHVPGAAQFIGEDGMTVEVPLSEAPEMAAGGEGGAFSLFERLLALTAGGVLVVLSSLQPWHVIVDAFGRLRTELPAWVRRVLEQGKPKPGP
jgi:GNAT superfamily N-acetyltransferase